MENPNLWSPCGIMGLLPSLPGCGLVFLLSQGMAGQTCTSKSCPAALRKPKSSQSAAVHPTLASADPVASVQMFKCLGQIRAYLKSLHSYSWEGRGFVYVVAHSEDER